MPCGRGGEDQFFNAMVRSDKRCSIGGQLELTAATLDPLLRCVGLICKSALRAAGSRSSLMAQS